MKIDFYSKILTDVSNEELERLTGLCRPGGSFFRVFLENVRIGAIRQPDLITLTFAHQDGTFVGWLFEDAGREYNQFEQSHHCSVHVYVTPAIRGQDVATNLFKARHDALRAHEKVLAYAPRQDDEFRFYRKLKGRLPLPQLSVRNPRVYLTPTFSEREQNGNSEQ
jgi:hypothetical protein